MHIASVSITLGDGLTLSTGSQFIIVVWFFAVSLYIYTAHYTILRFTEELRQRQVYCWNVQKQSPVLTNQSLYSMGAKCLKLTVFFIFLRTFWPLITSLIASVFMCSIPYDCWCFFPHRPTSGSCHTAQNADEKRRSGFMKCVVNVNSRTAYLSPAVKVEK